MILSDMGYMKPPHEQKGKHEIQINLSLIPIIGDSSFPQVHN